MLQGTNFQRFSLPSSGALLITLLLLCQAQNFSLVNHEEILYGGVAKDGIPAIDNPEFDSITETSFSGTELIIGVAQGKEAKAYPYAILNYHEIVNDEIDGTPIAITLCPLCDTTPVFVRKVFGQTTTFGVSGLLFHSCLVMYDRLSQTLWSQPWGEGIQGVNVMYALDQIPATVTTLDKWKKKYPNSKVLSPDGPYRRGDYSVYPYGDYRESERLLRFPVKHQERLAEQGLHPKEIVQYLTIPDPRPVFNRFSGQSYAVQRSSFESGGLYNRRELYFNLDSNSKIMAKWDAEMDAINFYNMTGGKSHQQAIPSSTAFAFAYVSLFDTEIH